MIFVIINNPLGLSAAIAQVNIIVIKTGKNKIADKRLFEYHLEERMYIKEGYCPQEAQLSMTLSTLAYASENNPTEIKKTLVEQLKNTNYATGGKWQLAWGPGLIINNSNMLYAVKHKEIPNLYAVSIRGTDPSFVFNILEDLEVLHLLPYTEAQSISGIEDISLAAGCWMGLQSITTAEGQVADSGESMTLLSFIKQLLKDSGDEQLQLYVTGHSLGGCLANVLTTWVADEIYRLHLPDEKLFLKTYTFAAPTSGNQNYVDYCRWQFFQQSRIKIESYRVNNKKDLVPYAWSSLAHVVKEGIPTKVPSILIPVVDAIDNYFRQHHIRYVHIENAHPIKEILTPTDCNQILDVIEYKCWVLFEHATATYLQLLGAPPVDEIALKRVPIVFAEPD